MHEQWEVLLRAEPANTNVCEGIRINLALRIGRRECKQIYAVFGEQHSAAKAQRMCVLI